MVPLALQGLGDTLGLGFLAGGLWSRGPDLSSRAGLVACLLNSCTDCIRGSFAVACNPFQLPSGLF